MITKLEILDPETTTVRHYTKAEGLRGKTCFEFKPGLQVLWGPNGVGKSTLLRVMGDILMCTQGQTQVVTNTSLGQFRTPVGVRLHHDGGACGFLDLSDTPGLVGGGAGFDYDFTELGVQGMMAKRQSAGQQSHQAIHSILARVFQPDAGLTWKIDRKNAQEPEGYQHESYKNWQACQEVHPCDKPVRTVLLDEPDRSMDFPAAAYLWSKLMRVRPEMLQIIVASHSVVPLLYMPRTHLVEMVPGYLDQCLKAREALMKGDEAPIWPPLATQEPQRKKKTSKARKAQKK